MTDPNHIDTVVREAISEVNGLLPPDRQVDSSPEAVWLAPHSSIDSLTVAYMIVAVEKKLNETYGITDTGLTALGSGPLEESPLYSMPNIVRHVRKLLEKHECHQ